METHLWHKYAAGLATLRSFFLKPNYHGNSAKGEGRGGVWRDMGVLFSAS